MPDFVNVKPKEPWYRRRWVLILSALIVVGAIIDGFSGEEEPIAPTAAEATVSPSPTPTSSPATPTPTPEPSPTPTSTLTASVAATWTVVDVIDGDTVDVSSSGITERVRIIGIDTPERGECGFGEASAALEALVLNQDVDLVPGARDDRDAYGRLLRYVDVNGVDAGLELIRDGLAIARYDSRDGYGSHPREGEYVEAADAATEHVCAAPTTSPSPAPPPPSPSPSSDTSASNPWGTSSCHPAYDPCVPPPSEVGDLDCPDIEKKYPSGVSVDHSHGDPHGLDGNTDGHGCGS